MLWFWNRLNAKSKKNLVVIRGEVIKNGDIVIHSLEIRNKIIKVIKELRIIIRLVSEFRWGKDIRLGCGNDVEQNRSTPVGYCNPPLLMFSVEGG